MKEIFEICDDVTLFRDGRFIAECPVSELQEDRLVEMMGGRKLKAQYPRLKLPRGEKCLQVKHLSGPGVNDARFTLYRGEILGVAGLIGAGRTELMKIIYGAVPRKAGSVTLDGHEVIAWPGERHRLYIQRPQARWPGIGHIGEGKHIADRTALF